MKLTSSLTTSKTVASFTIKFWYVLIIAKKRCKQFQAYPSYKSVDMDHGTTALFEEFHCSPLFTCEILIIRLHHPWWCQQHGSSSQRSQGTRSGTQAAPKGLNEMSQGPIKPSTKWPCKIHGASFNLCCCCCSSKTTLLDPCEKNTWWTYLFEWLGAGGWDKTQMIEPCVFDFQEITPGSGKLLCQSSLKSFDPYRESSLILMSKFSAMSLKPEILRKIHMFQSIPEQITGKLMVDGNCASNTWDLSNRTFTKTHTPSCSARMCPNTISEVMYRSLS